MATRTWDDPALTIDWPTARAGTLIPPELQAHHDLIRGQPGDISRFLPSPGSMPPGFTIPSLESCGVRYLKPLKAIDFMIARLTISPDDANFEGVPADFTMPSDDSFEEWLRPAYLPTPGYRAPAPPSPEVATLIASLNQLQATVNNQASAMADMRELLDSQNSASGPILADPLHSDALPLMPTSWQSRAPMPRADAAKLFKSYGNADFSDFAPRFVFPADLLVNSKANAKSISVKDIVHNHFHTVHKANADALKVGLKTLSNMLEFRDDLQELSARPDHDGNIPIADVVAAFNCLVEGAEKTTSLSANVSDTMVRISLDLFADAENFQFLKHKTVDRTESILPENTVELMRAQKDKADVISEARKNFTPRKNIFGGPPRSGASSGGGTNKRSRRSQNGRRGGNRSDNDNWSSRSNYRSSSSDRSRSDYRSSSSDRSSSSGKGGKGKGGKGGNRSSSRDRDETSDAPG